MHVQSKGVSQSVVRLRRPQKLGDIVEGGARASGSLRGSGGGEAGKTWSPNHPGPFLNGTSPPQERAVSLHHHP